MFTKVSLIYVIYLLLFISLIIICTDTFSHDILTGDLKKISSAAIIGGLVEHSRMIEYLYQLRYCIGSNGDLIPNENIDFPIPGSTRGDTLTYNPSEVVIHAIDISLSLHDLLSKRVLTATDIQHVMMLSVMCQISIQRLFCLKQLLAGINATSMVIKLHMLFHFFEFIILMGHCGLWNTDRAEFSHIEVKNLGRQSSRKKHYMAKEILQRDRTNRISKLASVAKQTEEEKLMVSCVNISLYFVNISLFFVNICNFIVILFYV